MTNCASAIESRVARIKARVAELTGTSTSTKIKGIPPLQETLPASISPVVGDKDSFTIKLDLALDITLIANWIRVYSETILQAHAKFQNPTADHVTEFWFMINVPKVR